MKRKAKKTVASKAQRSRELGQTTRAKVFRKSSIRQALKSKSEIRKAQREVKQRQQEKEALKVEQKFRSLHARKWRRDHRQEFVFVDKSGRVSRKGKGKGLHFYVNKNGRLLRVDKMLKRNPRLVRKGDVDTRRARKKRAQRKEDLRVKENQFGKTKSKKSTDFQDAIDSIWRDWKGLEKKLKPGRGLWKIRLEAQNNKSEISSLETSATFDPKDITPDKMFNSLYAGIADVADSAGYVSEGSYAFVEELDENGDVASDRAMTKRGMKWTKSGNQRFKWKNFVWHFSRLQEDEGD